MFHRLSLGAGCKPALFPLQGIAVCGWDLHGRGKGIEAEVASENGGDELSKSFQAMSL